MKFITMLLLISALSNRCLPQTGDTTQLKTVVVTAKKQLIIQKNDRIVYDLQSDPQSKGSSLLDMMRKVPYLSVDANENILLKSSQAYKVFIDGRPWGLATGNLKEILRSIPAVTVKSVEVITSPPAKYDAEGLAGIINILTIRQTINGYRGSVNLSGKNPIRRLGAGSSFALKQSGFGLSTITGLSRYNAPDTKIELKRTSFSTNPADLYQYTTNTANGNIAYCGLELSYESDSLNMISAGVSYNGSQSKELSTRVTELINTSTQHYRLESNNSINDNALNAVTRYERRFKKAKEQMLGVSYRYRTDNNTVLNDIALSDKMNYTASDYTQNLEEHFVEHTAMLDYAQPVNRLLVECGAKVTYRTTQSASTYNVLNGTTGEYETDSIRSNTLRYDHGILSVYGSGSYETSDWQVKTGLRIEKTLLSIGLINNGADMEQQYLNVLPVLAISRKWGRNQSMAFSYSARIQRPTSQELSPFVDRSNPAIETSGNPYLRPITSNVYQLSYIHAEKAIWNISIGCMFFNHVFDAFPIYDAATNTTQVRYENLGKGRVIKSNIAINYPVKDRWTFACNADVRHVSIGNGTDSLQVTNSGVDVYANISAAYQFKKWRVNADVTYKKGGILLPLGRTTGFIASSVGVSRTCFQSRLTLSASVNNPFNRYRNVAEEIRTDDFTQTVHKQVYQRVFALSINYNFGKLQGNLNKSNSASFINDI